MLALTAKSAQTQKLKSFHFNFFIYYFFNQVGVIVENFLVLLVNFVLVEGEYQMSKTLESVHGGKRDSYQDIEDLNQTVTQLTSQREIFDFFSSK